MKDTYLDDPDNRKAEKVYKEMKQEK